MKQHKVITQEILAKLDACFSDQEEIYTFLTSLKDVTDDLHFLILLSNKVEDKDLPNILMKQICVFALFCRENFDLVRELVEKIDWKNMTEEQINNLKGENG